MFNLLSTFCITVVMWDNGISTFLLKWESCKGTHIVVQTLCEMLAWELCKEVSSNGQGWLLHKREETSHNPLHCGCDLSMFCLVYFVFWLLIPSFNLRNFFKATIDQTSLMLAFFFKEKVKSFWPRGRCLVWKSLPHYMGKLPTFSYCEYLFLYTCSPVLFLTVSLFFFLSHCSLKHQGAAWSIPAVSLKSMQLC